MLMLITIFLECTITISHTYIAVLISSLSSVLEAQISLSLSLSFPK